MNLDDYSEKIDSEKNEHFIREFYLCDNNGSHEYVEDEVIENCTVQILKCKKCGECSVGWIRNNQ